MEGAAGIAPLVLARQRIDESESSESNESQAERTGLHPIVVPDNAKVIIVAIHGPTGSWKRSWRHPKSEYFWLKDAIPEKIPRASVYSFGYRGIVPSLAANDYRGIVPSLAANDLLGDLVDILPESKEQDLPIIFVGHSIGGVIAKQAFLLSHPETTRRERYQRLNKLMRSFLFLGTDQYRGFDPASIEVGTSFKRLLMQMQAHDVPSTKIFELLMISHQFAALGGERLVSACFWETERTMTRSSDLGSFRYVVDKPMAILNWSWVHEEGLNGNHTTMCQFEGATGNCTKVVSVLREAVERFDREPLLASPSTISPPRNPLPSVPSASSTAAKPKSSGEGLRILSLDGGGVKGLFAVIVLQAIMEQVRKIDCADKSDALRPCDYFDFICGTSTGGLLAIMLGRLRMDLVSCRDAYRSMSSKIFSEWRIPLKMYVWDAPLGNPWYSGDKLKAAIKDILHTRISTQEKENLGSGSIPPEEAPMLNKLDPTPQKARTILCAVQDNAEGNAGKCELLRTYDCNSATKPRAWSGKVWEACRATSAAPVYFEHIEVGQKCYFDGGLTSNNPIREVYKEARQEYPDRNFEAIVSIGTGKPPYKSPPRTLFAFMKQAMDQMTDTEAKHVDFLEEMENGQIEGGERASDIEEENLSDRYFRLNDAGSLYKIDLAAYRQLDKVEKAANDFVSSADGSNMIRDCARRLAFHRPVRA